MSPEDFAKAAEPYIRQSVKGDFDVAAIAALLQARCERLTDIPEKVDFFDACPEYDVEFFTNKKSKTNPEVCKAMLEAAIPMLEDLPAWTDEAIHDGLIARRILEIKLFLYGDYSGSSSPSYHYVKFETEQGKVEVEVDIAFYESGSAFTPYFKASCDTDTFLGWYKAGGTELREGDSVTQDMTLTAQWAGQTAGTGESGTGTSGDTEFNWWN